MKPIAPALLTDEQVQRYIADGYLIIDSSLESSLHAKITSQLSNALANELPHPGDNILPRVPDLDDICESPAVRGALISLLGEQYVMAPHRFPHNSEPIGEDGDPLSDPFENQPKMGKGSISGSAWHQDGHSRSGRSRWHTLRAANLFYFTHDTPLSMGPTRFLAGSHLYATLSGLCAEQVVMERIPAGSVVIADFDLGHAGTPNNSQVCRYMVKFVALRTQNPSEPTWSNKSPKWSTPADLKTPHHIPSAWTSLWNWLRGAPRSEGMTISPIDYLPSLLEEMQIEDQGIRLRALYDLVAMGEPAVDGLINILVSTSGQDRHVSPKPNDSAYYGMSPDFLDRRFSDRQFVPEDAAVALAAIGHSAAPSLARLLRHEDPWVRLNAAYALGDAGPDVTMAYVKELSGLLDDPYSSVIRVTMDAFCALGKFPKETVLRLHRFFIESNEEAYRSSAGEPALGWDWTMENQYRYLSSLALLACASNGDASEELETALIDALQDDTGYVPAMACQGLERLGSVKGLRAAIRYLQVRRWDSSHHTSLSQEGIIAKRHRETVLAQLSAA